MAKATLSILLVLSTALQCAAFAPATSPKATRSALRVSSPIGDLISGITGVAPSSLQPPVDVLSGTSIDPERDDVDLGRVYKVWLLITYIFLTALCMPDTLNSVNTVLTLHLIQASKDGWSAIDFHRCVGKHFFE